MSKKQDDFYFQNFIECAGYSCQAAHLLKEILSDFRPEDTRLRLDELHKIEHEADMKKHELSDRLTKAFITPIEREDIAALSEQIDDLTDKIEEVFIRIYINNVKAIRPEALKMLELVIQCCEEVCGLMREFANFRRSKELKDRIIQINSLEEEADRLYIASMHSLHSEEKDVLAVIAWREIYSYLEKCADACEHAADVVESIAEMQPGRVVYVSCDSATMARDVKRLADLGYTAQRAAEVGPVLSSFAGPVRTDLFLCGQNPGCGNESQGNPNDY